MAALAQIIPFDAFRRRRGNARGANDALTLAEAQLRWRARGLCVFIDTEIVGAETGERFLAIEVGDGDRYAAYALVPTPGGQWALIGPRGERLGAADDARDLAVRFDRALRRWLRRGDAKAFDLPFEETVRWRRRLRAWREPRAATRDGVSGQRVAMGGAAAWALFLSLDISNVGGGPSAGASAFVLKNGASKDEAARTAPQFVWTDDDVGAGGADAPPRLTVLSDGPLRIVRVLDDGEREGSRPPAVQADGASSHDDVPSVVVELDALSAPQTVLSFVALSDDAPPSVPLIRVTPGVQMDADGLALDPAAFQLAYEILFPEPDLPIQTEFVDDRSGSFMGVQFVSDFDAAFQSELADSGPDDVEGFDGSSSSSADATLVFDRSGGATLVIGATANEAFDIVVSLDAVSADPLLIASADEAAETPGPDAYSAAFVDWIAVG